MALAVLLGRPGCSIIVDRLFPCMERFIPENDHWIIMGIGAGSIDFRHCIRADSRIEIRYNMAWR